MTNEISRELLGKIVDEVFDGGLEDASVVEDIYRVIKREEGFAAPDDGWLPIESAPKDGHHFLAYCEDTVDEYDEDRLLRRGVKERYTVVAYWLWGQFVQFPFTGSIVQNRVFTHWRPLPAPPANGRGE